VAGSPFLPVSRATGFGASRHHAASSYPRSPAKMEWAPSRRVDVASKGQLGN
jgi:hypothetical protein